jgi:tRNA pseudouridine13 synthase
MAWTWLPSLPLLTGDLPGIGGQLKVEPEDFCVEEIPAYEPSGQGEFLYLWIEKRDMGGEYFQKQLARRLGIRKEEVGAAGLKDRRAVTRQWVSVPKQAEAQLLAIDGEGMKLLQTSRHTNKLKPGHLRGNRFVIRLRDVAEDATNRLELILARIRQKGMMNFYGEQRFGKEGETLDLGLRLLRGEGDIRERFLRKLSLSAVQSALFNAYLAKRFQDGLLHCVLSGDVMGKWPVGGMFVAEDVPTEQARFERREIVHAGPMYGSKMYPAQQEAAEREAVLLAEAGLTLKNFVGFGKLLQGTRRHNLVYVDDLSGQVEGNDAVLSFTLPAGSYATVLLNEVTKTGTIDESAS